jgi:fucose permease
LGFGDAHDFEYLRAAKPGCVKSNYWLEKPMSGPYELVPVTIASAFVLGLVIALLGSIKVPLAQRLGLDEGRAGGLLAGLNLAIIPMILFSGLIADRVGLRYVVVGGSLAAAAGCVTLGLGQSYRSALAALFALGVGAACLSTGAMLLMPRAFFDGEYPAAATNLGNVFFGLGALATPALADVLIRGIGFRRALTFLGIICLVPTLAAAFNAPDAFRWSKEQTSSLSDVFTSPVLWVTALVFLLYYPLEGTLGTWATSYLAEQGYSARRAALLLSGFWLSFVTARLLAAFLQHEEILPRNSEPALIVGLALLAAVFLGNLTGTHGRAAAGLGLLAVGACLGPVFPTLVGILFGHFDPPQYGTAYGTVYALGALGGLLIAPAMGAYARRTSVRTALRIPTFVALLLAAAALALGLTINLSH